MKTSNKACRSQVQNRNAFVANNIFAEYVTQNADGQPLDTCRYVVYSYGKHWPLFIYEGGHWYENCDKYSPSTSRHQNQARPIDFNLTMPMTTEQMQTIVRWGIAGLASKGVNN